MAERLVVVQIPLHPTLSLCPWARILWFQTFFLSTTRVEKVRSSTAVQNGTKIISNKSLIGRMDKKLMATDQLRAFQSRSRLPSLSQLPTRTATHLWAVHYN